MTPRDLTSVGLALLGIYFVVQSLPYLTITPFFVDPEFAAGLVPRRVGMLILAVLLISYRHRWAARLFPSSSTEEPLSVAALPASGFLLLGAYVVVSGIGTMAGALPVAFGETRFGAHLMGWGQFSSGLVSVIAGLGLVWWARSLTRKA